MKVIPANKFAAHEGFEVKIFNRKYIVIYIVILYHPIKLHTIDIEILCLIIDVEYVTRFSTFSPIPFGVEVAIHA